MRTHHVVAGVTTLLGVNMSITTYSALATAAVMALAPLAPVQAAFSGYYAPSNWTLLNVNSDGYVDSSAAPDAITLVGSDNGSGDFGDTYWWIAAPTSGTVSFDWFYASFDNPGFDNAYFAIASDEADFLDFSASYEFLSDIDGDSGTFSIFVNAGELIAFNVDSVDGLFSPGELTIRNFSGPAVPEPAAWAMMIAGFGLVGAAMRRRKAAPSFA